MKKFLYVLFFAAATLLSSCQKDTGTSEAISHTDLVAVNSQLKGTWVFPVQTLSVVDSSGKVLLPSQSQPAPAFQFDGSTKVNIMPDSKTVLKGTYTLSTNKNFIYININYPDGTTAQYQVLSMNNLSLKLSSTQPYAYYTGATEIAATAVVNTAFTRQSSADVTGHLIRITASSDSMYNIGVYVQHKGADTASLVSQQSNLIGHFTYSFSAKTGDHLSLDIFGSSTTTFYAYYDGIPLTGQVQLLGTEIKTDTGWDVP